MIKNSPVNRNLFSEFPPVSRKEWEERIHSDLKGADYKKALTWKTVEGFDILPFYRSDNLKRAHSEPMPLPARWRYCEPIPEQNPQKANHAIKEAVNGGADSVSVHCRATPHSGALGGDIAGTQIQSQKDLSVLFEDISLSELHLFFDSGMTSPALMAMLQNHLSESCDASFLFDPFTYVAQHGRMPLPDEELNNIIQHLSQQPYLTLAADALCFQQAGATLVQEVGIALSIGSEFLSRCKKEDREKAAQSLFVRLSAGSLYFPEIAKIRALRLLWSQMLAAYGIEDSAPLWVHSETTQTDKTITDAHTNMLRTTTAAMSAVLGGANNLVIHPYDSGYQKPSAFSRRIARNVHHILNEEAGMGRVSDPSAGSYYLENLTDIIAEKSWGFFQLIEKQGGFLEALRNRVIHSEINSSRKEKEKMYAERRRVLVGTNQFPNPEEGLPDTPYQADSVTSLSLSGETYNSDKNNIIPSLKAVFMKGATVGDIIPAILSPQKVLYPVIEPYHAGRVFEQIRLKTKKISHQKSYIPVVVLVPVGDAKMRKARASFAQNALGCAGFKIIQPLGYTTVKEAKTDLKETEADIYVLCSSDAEYETLAPSFCETFSGSTNLLILAGDPEKHKQFRKNGIDYFIHSGMDLPEFLYKLQQQLFDTETD